MRAFSVGVSVVLSSGESGVGPAELGELAKRLEAVGVEALFVAAEPDLEPITALAGVAPLCDLVLGAVVSMSSSRLPTIVAKRATTLALLAPGRSALVFRDDEPASQVELLEAVKAASMMRGDGPLDFVGATIRLIGAYNEPRPDPSSALAVGAWTVAPTSVLLQECDVLITEERDVADAASWVFSVFARRAVEPSAGSSATKSDATLFEIEGGDLNRICAIARRLVAGVVR